ncbi:Helix-turn-helix domain-containing protein [Porphyromonadaceae bacterium KH3R12]|uniref:helix-turn-helix transcriptional regulator n=1 Tax=Proteiniphilum saccharofermentans TaxID=1642647 RepID=UPI00089CE261|nr:AraC family transcriptional regulator [Proteiniphilum saccharofermentans]SEA28318.1 Helix-turn-helix domain-containing protein [Porphyromonadaceae bacterium KH3R12]
MLFSLLLSVMPMFVCLFWVILLLSGRERNLSKRYLAFFLSLSVINYFTHAAFFNHEYKLFAFMDNVWVFTSLVGYPLYYYYIRLLTRDVKINWRWNWIAAPAFLLSLFSFVIYFTMSPAELDMFIHGVMYHEAGYTEPYPQLVRLQLLRMSLFRIVFIVQVALSVYFGLRLIIRYNKNVREFYSNTGGKDLSPVKWLLFAFLFASVISLLSNVIGKDFFIDKPALLAIPSVTHSLFLFFIGYVGYHQDFTIAHFVKDMNDYRDQKAFLNGKGSLSSKNRITKRQLTHLMEEEKLFTNPELRITDIALMLGTNRTYISRIVNEEMKTNFCDWINSYRIDYAVNIMNDPEQNHLSALHISEMSGFSSVSVFYRTFKEKQGISPGKYRSLNG